MPHLTLAAAKNEAKALRKVREQENAPISHSEALELVAKRHGYRDWNGLHAAIGNRAPPDWQAGQIVRGQYLSQEFEAEILSVEPVRPGWFRLVLNLVEPVDVVSFDSFSNFRHRVQAVVGPLGETRERISDGKPHLVLHQSTDQASAKSGQERGKS